MNKKIDIEKLKAVTTIVTHDNCTDGLSAAMLLHDVLPDAEIIFAQHGTEPYGKLEARPYMLFVDIVPPSERYEEFLKMGAIVLDHHKGVKDIVEKFGELAVFGDEKLNPGISGAPLVYRHVWKPFQALRRKDWKESADYDPLYEEMWDAHEQFVARFAERAGIRDTWQRSNPEWYESTLQGEILYFWPREFWLDTKFEEISKHWDSKFHPVGSILMKKQVKSTQYVLAEAYHFVSDRGTKVTCFNSTRASSDIAEAMDKDTDLIIGFKYKCDKTEAGLEPKMLHSTRSHTFYDCMSFTKWYGGGGHTKAAGFGASVKPEDANPYTYIKNVVNAYEEKHPFAAKLHPCGTCSKLGHKPQDHAGWDPTQEGRG